MRYTNDDFNQFYSDDIGYRAPSNSLPIDKVKVNSEIDSMIANAELSGMDLSDPYAMSGFLDDIMSKLKSIGKSISGGKDITIATESGITTVGPSGVAYVSTEGKTASNVPVTASQQFTNYLKNPYVIASLVGIPLLIYVLNKKKKKR